MTSTKTIVPVIAHPDVRIVLLNLHILQPGANMKDLQSTMTTPTANPITGINPPGKTVMHGDHGALSRHLPLLQRDAQSQSTWRDHTHQDSYQTQSWQDYETHLDLRHACQQHRNQSQDRSRHPRHPGKNLPSPPNRVPGTNQNITPGQPRQFREVTFRCRSKMTTAMSGSKRYGLA
jgi:hypothetical protein